MPGQATWPGVSRRRPDAASEWARNDPESRVDIPGRPYRAALRPGRYPAGRRGDRGYAHGIVARFPPWPRLARSPQGPYRRTGSGPVAAGERPLPGYYPVGWHTLGNIREARKLSICHSTPSPALPGPAVIC